MHPWAISEDPLFVSEKTILFLWLSELYLVTRIARACFWYYLTWFPQQGIFPRFVLGPGVEQCVFLKWPARKTPECPTGRSMNGKAVPRHSIAWLYIHGGANVGNVKWSRLQTVQAQFPGNAVRLRVVPGNDVSKMLNKYNRKQWFSG